MQPRKRIERGVYHNRHTKIDTGGVHLSTQGMRPAKPKPCKECPFLREAEPGFLGGYSPEMFVEAVLSPASLACHCSPGFHERVIETQRHCTGLAGFRANIGWIASVRHPVDGSVVLSNAHASTQLVGSNTELYFATIDEFVAHHASGQQPALAGEAGE